MTFRAAGAWSMGLGTVSPDGRIDWCECPVRHEVGSRSQGPIGALVGRIGERGDPFLIGRGATITAAQPGALFLAANDNLGPCDSANRGSCYDDNEGRLEVCVTLSEGGAAPNRASPARLQGSPPQGEESVQMGRLARQLAMDPPPCPVIEEAARALGPAAVPTLIGVVDRPTARGRLCAIDTVGRLGDERAVQPLLRASHDSDATVRSRAAAALGMIGHASAVPRLREMLADDTGFVRYSSAQALAALEDPASVRLLIEELEFERTSSRSGGSGSEMLRQARVERLGSLLRGMGQRAVPELAQLAEGGDASLRSAAIAYLMELSDTDALQAILRRRGQRDRFRAVLIEAGMNAAVVLTALRSDARREPAKARFLENALLVLDERAYATWKNAP